MRPLCKACERRLAAVNCHRNGKIYYRSRCDSCIRKQRKIKPPVPRWRSLGYVKKKVCDCCGFISRHASQILVYHVNGNLNDCSLTNLRSVCLNCTEDILRNDLPWRPGDLSPDA